MLIYLFLRERRYKIPKLDNEKEISNIEFKEYEDKRKKDIAKAHKKVYKAFNITHEPEKLIAIVQVKISMFVILQPCKWH